MGRSRSESSCAQAEGSLPWANFSPFRQGTIPLLPPLPPSCPVGVEWTGAHTPAWRGRSSPTSPAPAAAQTVLCLPAAAKRTPKAQGFQQGDGRDRATQLSGDWGAAGLKPVPRLQSHQPPVVRSRTGSVLGSTRAVAQSPCPPCGRPVKWRCHPFHTSSWWVAGRVPRLQGSHGGRDPCWAAWAPEATKAGGSHLRPPNSAPGAWLGLCWFGRCPRSPGASRCPPQATQITTSWTRTPGSRPAPEGILDEVKTTLLRFNSRSGSVLF